jgi:hypothetical protein
MLIDRRRDDLDFRHQLFCEDHSVEFPYHLFLLKQFQQLQLFSRLFKKKIFFFSKKDVSMYSLAFFELIVYCSIIVCLYVCC